MAYTVPLRFLRVSKERGELSSADIVICLTRVIAIMSCESVQARRTLKDERQSGTLINAAGREKAKSVIILDNGSVIASPLSVAVLMNAIEKSEYRRSGHDKKTTIDIYSKEKEECSEEPLDIDISEDEGEEKEEDDNESLEEPDDESYDNLMNEILGEDENGKD